MAYIASIVENLSVLCNPVWVVDSNREWMSETQSLIVKHQRLQSLKKCINFADENETERLNVSGNSKNCKRVFTASGVSEFQNALGKEEHVDTTATDRADSNASPEIVLTSENWHSRRSSPHQCELLSCQAKEPTTTTESCSYATETLGSLRKYSLFDNETWLEFPKLETLSCSGLASEPEELPCRSEPCRNDPAAWAGWMRCRPAEPDTGLSPAHISGLLQKPVTSPELQEITDTVLRRSDPDQQQLQEALSKPELRQLWDIKPSPEARRDSKGSKQTGPASEQACSESTYAAVAGATQERSIWPYSAMPKQRSTVSWPHKPSSGASFSSQGDPTSGRFSAPLAQTNVTNHGVSSAPRAPQDLGFTPVTTYSVTATYTSAALLPGASQQVDAPDSLMVAMPQGSLLMPSLNSLARRSGDVRVDDCILGGPHQQAESSAAWPERSSTWYPVAGWHYPTQQGTNSSRYLGQQGGGNAAPSQYQPPKASTHSPFIAHDPQLPSQQTRRQGVNSATYPQNKNVSSPPYQPQTTTTAFVKYEAQPSVLPLGSALRPIRPVAADPAAYKSIQKILCQKNTVAATSSRSSEFRHSNSDTSLRTGNDQQRKTSATVEQVSADRDPTPTESPRAPPHATFEDFLHLLGVSDGNNTDLFELWRIGQVGGSSGPPSTELSPRSDALTPTAASSTPRDPASSTAPAQLRRSKSLGSLPSMPGHQQSVSSSASRDSVTRRFEELEFLAIEQYESSDSLSRRFSDLERQALEQYALLSQQGSRETLPVPPPAAIAPPPPPPPPAASVPVNSRGAQARPNAGGKPRKRRGKKKARELVVDTGGSQQGAWRPPSRANSASAASGGKNPGWSAGEDKASRRSWTGAGQSCVVDNRHTGVVGNSSGAGYSGALQHDLSKQAPTGFRGPGYPASGLEFAASYPVSATASGGIRLPPPSFPSSADQQGPVMTSMPAGLLNIGPLGPQACREALAHAARLPAAPLLWPQGFTAAANRNEATRQANAGQETATGDAETSCVLQ